MKKSLFFLLAVTALALPHTATMATPTDYTPITWAKAAGIHSYFKAPSGNGYGDYLTVINLATTQIKLVASSTPRQDWGAGNAPLNSDDVHNWAFSRLVAEQAKALNPDAKFFWNAPFFNVTLPITDLSLSLKSADTTSTYITSGSRPAGDIAQIRRMLIIDNKTNTAAISDFNETTLINDGDQAVEGFGPLVTPGGTTVTSRLFLGTRNSGKELVVYCSSGASPQEASQALTDAGVAEQNQLQLDGGGSATCGYNLPGQYFVEPGRTLPHLMAVFPYTYKATASTNDINVRTGPSTKYSVARRLKKGEIIYVAEVKNGWARVLNTNEWILASLLKK